MEFENIGDVRVSEVEIVEISELKRTTLILLNPFALEWEKCMHHCQKFYNSRAPPIVSQQELTTLIRRIQKIAKVAASSIWSLISDKKGRRQMG